ncbi:MAG: TIGR01777 family protein [Dehalococcoidia bacterium]|nr:TIGR01777 family protein [Dehalococcoidia bacterium]
MRVLITGASGLIGGALARALLARGDEVVGVSRRPAGRGGGIRWFGWDELPRALAGMDAAVHLAGAPIGLWRWTSARKRELRASRIDTAARLAAAIAAGAAGGGPRVLISASAVGYYGGRGDEELTESSTPGAGFLAQLCRDWERAASGAGVRTVLVRCGVVLTPRGDPLRLMLWPFRLGLGGPLAGGRQWFPWVHLDDCVGVYLHALDHAAVEGPLNAVAPEPAINGDFTRALARTLHRPAFVPVPGWALRLALREAASVITGSQRVRPRRTQELGYAFRHPAIDEALRDLLA